MTKPRSIDSLQNPLVKRVILLKEKSKWRKKEGQFVVEGLRETSMAVRGGLKLETILYYPGIIALEELKNSIRISGTEPEFIEVSQEVYKRLAYREKTEGILAVGKARSHDLAELELKRAQPLLLIAENLEKPGNLGALLRTADAADLDAVIIANPRTDLYNPNVIRSSLGCVFTVPVGIAETPHVIEFLRKKNIHSFAAELGAESRYSEMDFCQPAAIVVGAESTGLSELWLESADHRIIIPMLGQIDSMNVSVSAAILIFEAKRQRNFQ